MVRLRSLYPPVSYALSVPAGVTCNMERTDFACQQSTGLDQYCRTIRADSESQNSKCVGNVKWCTLTRIRTLRVGNLLRTDTARSAARGRFATPSCSTANGGGSLQRISAQNICSRSPQPLKDSKFMTPVSFRPFSLPALQLPSPSASQPFSLPALQPFSLPALQPPSPSSPFQPFRGPWEPLGAPGSPGVTRCCFEETQATVLSTSSGLIRWKNPRARSPTHSLSQNSGRGPSQNSGWPADSLSQNSGWNRSSGREIARYGAHPSHPGIREIDRGTSVSSKRSVHRHKIS